MLVNNFAFILLCLALPHSEGTKTSHKNLKQSLGHRGAWRQKGKEVQTFGNVFPHSSHPAHQAGIFMQTESMRAVPEQAALPEYFPFNPCFHGRPSKPVSEGRDSSFLTDCSRHSALWNTSFPQEFINLHIREHIIPIFRQEANKKADTGIQNQCPALKWVIQSTKS